MKRMNAVGALMGAALCVGSACAVVDGSDLYDGQVDGRASRLVQSSCFRSAMATASVRLAASIFVRMPLTCSSTLSMRMCSSPAMSRFVRPFAK